MFEKKYNLIQMPFFAFFSKRIYSDVGLRWKGFNLAYLFVLLAVCCIPYTLNFREQTLKSLESSHVGILNQMPEIQIKNGIVSIDAPQQPYYIKNSAGQPIAIIDTTGSMNYIDNESVQLLLTETRLVIRRGRNLFNTFSLDMVEDLYLDQHVVNGWLQTIRAAVAPLSYGIFLMLSYVFAVIALLLAAIIGLIISAAMHKHLSFASVLRMSTVAATPAIIFVMVSATTGTHIPAIAFAALTLLYLFNGIKACGDSSQADDEHVDLKALLDEEVASAQKAA